MFLLTLGGFTAFFACIAWRQYAQDVFNTREK